MYVNSVCAVYDDYIDIIGDYTGENVVEADGTVNFLYTHTDNSDITIQLINVAGNNEVNNILSKN